MRPPPQGRRVASVPASAWLVPPAVCVLVLLAPVVVRVQLRWSHNAFLADPVPRRGRRSHAPRKRGGLRPPRGLRRAG